MVTPGAEPGDEGTALVMMRSWHACPSPPGLPHPQRNRARPGGERCPCQPASRLAGRPAGQGDGAQPVSARPSWRPQQRGRYWRVVSPAGGSDCTGDTGGADVGSAEGGGLGTPVGWRSGPGSSVTAGSPSSTRGA